MISARTKAALAAARARGVKLGGYNKNPVLTAEARRAGNATNSRKAAARAKDVAPIIADIKASGTTSLRQIAAELNNRGILTARGSAWTPIQVSRALNKVGPRE